jgi:hypothetical protein
MHNVSSSLSPIAFQVVHNHEGLVTSAILYSIFFFLGATAPIWALAYFHETLRFTSVF